MPYVLAGKERTLPVMRLNSVMLRPRQGFTLAEFLMVIAVLGIISIFTIPKLLQNQANTKKKAVYRETIATVENFFYKVRTTGEYTPYTLSTLIHKYINASKFCSQGVSQQCWDHTNDTGGIPTYSAFVLHNGAVVGGYSDCCDWGGGIMGHYFMIDWNKEEGPNVCGEDQMLLWACTGTADCWGLPVNKLTPLDACSRTLYEDIFSSGY